MTPLAWYIRQELPVWLGVIQRRHEVAIDGAFPENDDQEISRRGENENIVLFQAYFLVY